MAHLRAPRAAEGTRRRVAGALLATSVLVGLVSACTDGAAGGRSPVGGTSTAAPVPTPTDPAPADVRTAGTAISPNGVAVSAVTSGAVTPAARTDPDGSVHLRLQVSGSPAAGAGTGPAATTPGAGSAAPAVDTPGPLAWLTGPDGSTAAVLGDGSAVISAADGAFLLGLSAPTPSARFTVVGTPAAVLRIDRVAGGLTATAPSAPVTTWLSGTAVASATWGVAEGGRSLEITPSEWARSGTLAAQQGLWSQLVAQHPDANSPTMHDQLLCHVLGAAGKSTWHIEPWRPQVDALTMLRTRCNPTTADVSTPPAPTAAIG